MDFIKEKGYVTITMLKYINDIRTLYKIEGTVSDPATETLFHVNENSEKLSPILGKEYHSKVMKLMWLAKREVPEILVAVSFLLTRIKDPSFLSFSLWTKRKYFCR